MKLWLSFIKPIQLRYYTLLTPILTITRNDRIIKYALVKPWFRWDFYFWSCEDKVWKTIPL